jgi:acetolactate synthase I/II/III large subunit
VKVYEALAQAFVDQGTRAVFTMMGDANMYWLNALDRLDVDIFDVRHEGAGLAMADGFARASGEPGVCSTTGGPGTTQLATTMVVASRARSPLVAFCGDSAVGDVQDAQHFEQQRFAAAIEADYVRVQSARTACDAVTEAFARARSGPGPVLLSVPQDIQQEAVDRMSPTTAKMSDLQMPSPDDDEADRAAALIQRSQRPVVLVGRGALRAGAAEEVLALADRIGALVATTLLAKNWLADHPWHLGIAGGYGTRAARQLLAAADCVVAVGASVSPYTSDRGTLFEDATIVQIDHRRDMVMGDGRRADCAVTADAKAGVEALLARLERRSDSGYRTTDVQAQLARAYDDDQIVDLEPGTVDPREACRVLDDAIPEHISLILGSGQQIRFPTMLMRRPRPLILAQHHFGCIGQGLTTAVGAVVATGRPAMTIEGDAGLMMHLAEFETAVRYELPLLVVVMNDEALGAEFHKSVAVGLDGDLTLIRTPDLGSVGVSLGGRGHLVCDLGELAAAAKEFADDPVPTLLDVRISRRVLSIPYRRTFYGEDV